MFSLVKPYLGSFYKLIPAAVLTVVIGILLVLFLKTRLGLSIRATGDNPDMVRASSINTAFTVTVGLCLSNAMTALSGAVLAQYQKTADINLGTGMVIIGLASPDHRRDPDAQRQDMDEGAGGDPRLHSLPVYHRHRPAARSAQRMPEADLRRHRGAGHRPAGH